MNIVWPDLDPLPRLLETATDAWKRKDFQKSIDILERAHQMAPTEAGVLLQLGYCYGSRYDFTAANDRFEKAIRITIRKTDARIVAGTHFLNFQQHDIAGKYFERALADNGNAVDALMPLVEIRERQNRMEEAAQLLNRILRSQAGFLPALVASARIQRHSKRLEEAEQTLRPFIDKPHSDIVTHANAWYEMGMVLDGQRRYDEAMAAFLKAKALAAPLTASSGDIRKEVWKARKTMVETLSADQLRRWHKSALATGHEHRFALLCGFPRSGTTLLEQILDSHPAIVSLEETPIFLEDILLPMAGDEVVGSVPLLPQLDSMSTDQWSGFRGQYFQSIRNFLGQPVGNRLLVDKNPGLTPFIPAVLRILPEAKFLVALRDPRDVCLSCFTLPTVNSPASPVFRSLEATITEYASAMGLWCAIKPIMPNPFLEVRYEDTVEDLPSVSRRTLEFLEMPWDDRVLEFQKHTQNKVVRSPTYADVRKPVTKRAVGRWRNYQKYLEPHLPILEPFLKAFGYE